MIIRPTTEADFPAIAALTNHFIRTSAIHFSYDEIAPAEFAAMHRDSQPRFPWFTAEIDSRFAGYAKAGTWRTRSAYNWTAEVGVYIEPDFHGRGVGKALYSTLIADLRTRGFHSLIGGVTLPNPASVRLHESLGFEYVGTYRRAGFKRGQWHDVGFWQLMLVGPDHEPT